MPQNFPSIQYELMIGWMAYRQVLLDSLFKVSIQLELVQYACAYMYMYMYMHQLLITGNKFRLIGDVYIKWLVLFPWVALSVIAWARLGLTSSLLRLLPSVGLPPSTVPLVFPSVILVFFSALQCDVAPLSIPFQGFSWSADANSF